MYSCPICSPLHIQVRLTDTEDSITPKPTAPSLRSLSPFSISKMLAVHFLTFSHEQGHLLRQSLENIALCGFIQTEALPLSHTFPFDFRFCAKLTWSQEPLRTEPLRILLAAATWAPAVPCWQGSSWLLMDHRRDKRITLPPGLFSLAFVVLGFCEAPAQSGQSNTSHFLGGYGLAACRSLAPWCLTTILTLSMQLLAPVSLTPTSISSETHKTWSPTSSCTPFCFALTDRPEWVTRWQQQTQKICSKWLLAGFTTSLFVSPEMLPPYCLVPRKLNWGRWLAGVTLNPREESVLSFTVLGVSPPSHPAPIFYISSRAWHLSPSSATAFCMVCGGNCHTVLCFRLSTVRGADTPLSQSWQKLPGSLTGKDLSTSEWRITTVRDTPWTERSRLCRKTNGAEVYSGNL